MRSLRKCLFKFNEWPRQSYFAFVAVMEVDIVFQFLSKCVSSTKIFHTFGLALLCFLVLPNLDSVKGLLVTSCFALGNTINHKKINGINNCLYGK